jgi:DNA-binding NarL/FixJ family response regulator
VENVLKVLLAEDSALLRAGLEQLLKALGHEVLTVVDASELRDATMASDENGQKYDVIITDVRMPPTMTDDGLRAVYELRKQYPSQPVMVLSQYVAASYLDRLLEHGGFGYLLKERVSDVDEFVHSLNEVARGGTVVDPEVVSALLSARRTGLAALTPREKEVLALMARGLSNSEIMDELVLTAGAVSKHVASVFMKLGFAPEDANRRVKAVLAWLRHTER